MSSASASRTSDREMAKLQAKANLFLALYSHVAQDLEVTRAKADVLLRQLAGLHGELASAQQQHESAQQQHESAQQQLAQARAERDAAREQVGRMTSDLAHLQRQHDSVLSSTSWRITAPVRAVARVAKRQ